MKFIFVIGYQQHYSKSIEKIDPERLERMRATIKNNENYVFFIVDLFEDPESSYIPHDIRSRKNKLSDKTFIIYEKQNCFIDTESIVKKVLDFDKDEKLSGIEVFNMTDNICGGRNLARGIKEWMPEKHLIMLY